MEAEPNPCHKQLLALASLVYCNSGLACLLPAFEFEPGNIAGKFKIDSKTNSDLALVYEQISLLANDLMVIMMSEEEEEESSDNDDDDDDDSLYEDCD